MPVGDTKTLVGSLNPLKSPLITTFKAFLENLDLSPITNPKVLILNRVENSIQSITGGFNSFGVQSVMSKKGNSED